MFKSDDQNSKSARSKPHSDKGLAQNSGLSILAEGCTFQGKMFLRGNARIAGIVEGTIVSNHELVLEPSAKVTGNVFGVKILVCGKIDGVVTASDVVHFLPTAQLEGDVESPRFIIEDGAMINGRLKTNHASVPEFENVRHISLKKAG